MTRDGRSLWTSNSIRTGGFSVENEVYEKSDEGGDRSDTDEASLVEPKSVPDPLDIEQLVSPKSDSEPTPKNVLQGGEAYIKALRVPLPASTENLVADDQGAATEVIQDAEEDLTPNEGTQSLA
jgi:hypothetical protein